MSSGNVRVARFVIKWKFSQLRRLAYILKPANNKVGLYYKHAVHTHLVTY